MNYLHPGDHSKVKVGTIKLISKNMFNTYFPLLNSLKLKLNSLINN